jgi:hypothetical protein
MKTYNKISAEEAVEERVGPMSRKERRLRRYWGMLICEWCGRWTDLNLGQMSYYEWEEYVDKNPYVMCSREQCKKERSDAGIGTKWNGTDLVFA